MCFECLGMFVNRRRSRVHRFIENRGRGTRSWRQILDRKYKCGRFAHAQWKICIITRRPYSTCEWSHIFVLTGVGKVDHIRQVLGPERTLTNSRTSTDCVTWPWFASVPGVQLEVFSSSWTMHWPLACLSTTARWWRWWWWCYRPTDRSLSVRITAYTQNILG